MSDYVPRFHFDPKMNVKEELAYAKFDVLKDDPNFKWFLYERVMFEAIDLKYWVDHADDDEAANDDLQTITDCFNYFLFEELRQERETVKDFICRVYLDRWSPYVYDPLIYLYDPSINYKERA